MTFNEICNGAYVFPLFSDAFCNELIKETEKYGKWSPGGDDKRPDNRLGGVVENVPTQDIHLNQINFDKQWEHIVFNYIAPIASHIYDGYSTKSINISFVIKYSVDGQKELKYHHDSSTYTLKVALNRRNIDFEGGGAYFLKYKASDGDYMDRGMGIIHPGKLTHKHKGVPITSGTRYVLVSFIN